MRFKHVHIENFMSFKDEVFVLEDQGLTLVLGENQGTRSKDSNGAGKSSLLDAFCWGLWGATIKGIKDDEVINYTVNKDCKVTVVFEDAGSVYEVLRYRACKELDPHNGLMLTINGEPSSQASVAATQDRILRILDLDFQTFQCMMPGSSIKIAQLTDGAIKNILERLLQLEVFADSHKLAKEEAKELSNEISSLSREIHIGEVQAEQRRTSIALITDQIAQFAINKADQVKHAEKVVQTAQIALERLPEVPPLEYLVSERKLAASLYTELGLEYNKEQSYAQGVVRRLNDAVTLITSQKQHLEFQRNHLVSEHKQVSSLSGVCTECRQKIGDTHKQSLQASLQDQIDTLNSDILILTAEEIRQSRLAQTTKSDLTTHLNKLKEEATVAAQNISSLDTKILTAKSNKLLYIAKMSAYEQSVEALRVESERTCELQPVLERDQKLLMDQEAVLAKQSASLAQATKKLEQLEFWNEAFGAQGLRPHLLRHVTPILNRKVQQYADIATSGDMKIEFETEKIQRNGKTKGIFSIKVEHKDGGTTYKGSSSGEKARADVCIALALGDLAASRSSKSINFRFMDEPFENIDNSGLGGIVSLLTQQSANFGSIFCVTHNQSLREYFPNTLTVVKQNKVSHLK